MSVSLPAWLFNKCVAPRPPVGAVKQNVGPVVVALPEYAALEQALSSRRAAVTLHSLAPHWRTSTRSAARRLRRQPLLVDAPVDRGRWRLAAACMVLRSGEAGLSLNGLLYACCREASMLSKAMEVWKPAASMSVKPDAQPTEKLLLANSTQHKHDEAFGVFDAIDAGVQPRAAACTALVRQHTPCVSPRAPRRLPP